MKTRWTIGRRTMSLDRQNDEVFRLVRLDSVELDEEGAPKPRTFCEDRIALEGCSDALIAKLLDFLNAQDD